jgi:dimethylhistidine N-methyltransferase
MSERSVTPSWRGSFRFFDLHPRSANMSEEVLDGLSREPKSLPPKYFYDAAGSVLFERITRLAEYYPTRTEMALFDAHLEELAHTLGSAFCLVEYGSGSTLKVRKLLQRLRPSAYVPVDISGEHLVAEARALHGDFPWLDVFPTCADYTAPFALPAPVRGLPHVGFFPGSSIGNFDPAGARQFLANVRVTLGRGGNLLIGVDRKKNVDVLERAYNDSLGITAEFNRNILRHINDRLGANFDTSAFAHQARYDRERGCIQMFLRSVKDQSVRIGNAEIGFSAGELIHTENSFKYDREEFLELAQRGGFEPVQWWTDAADWFALFLLRAV